jgi:hypothetical protein
VVSDNAVQVSTKKPDGAIYVVGGQDFDAFISNAIALFEGDQSALDALLADMIRSFLPVSATSTAQHTPPAGQQFYGQSQPQTQYSPTMRVAQSPVYFDSPYQDRDAVKAAGGRWDKERKSWYAPVGSDLTQFAKWLPPGV